MNIKTAPRKVARFVRRHQTTIAVVATTVVLTAVHVKVIANHNEFLQEHDLFDKFYNEED